MGAGDAILSALAEIKADLKRIESKIEGVRATSHSAPAAGGAVAPDFELDSQYGDPAVRKSPPRWSGDSFDGKPFSQCSAEFLDVLAEFKDWQAGADERKAPSLTEEEREKKLKYARYGRSDAARARGWAARIRRGWKPPMSEAAPPLDLGDRWG